MDTTNAQEADPARVSAFFKVLPPEIRLNVYKVAFDESRVHALLTMEDEPSGGKHYLLRLRHSAHFNLLRSCRKIYDEALPTYWSETVLSLSEPEVSLWDLVETAWGGGVLLTHDDYSYHLCSALPEVAKMNVRHIRDMLLPLLYGDFVNENPQLTAPALLGNFQALATCEITPTIDRHRERGLGPTVESYFETYTEDTESDLKTPLPHVFGRFRMSWAWEKGQHELKNSLHAFYGIDADAETVFLCKTRKFIGYEYDEPDPEERVLIVDRFWNLSTGIFCEVDACKVRDEEGYEMVMRPKPDFVAESST